MCFAFQSYLTQFFVGYLKGIQSWLNYSLHVANTACCYEVDSNRIQSVRPLSDLFRCKRVHPQTAASVIVSHNQTFKVTLCWELWQLQTHRWQVGLPQSEPGHRPIYLKKRRSVWRWVCCLTGCVNSTNGDGTQVSHFPTQCLNYYAERTSSRSEDDIWGLRPDSKWLLLHSG
jgi:hypothetical protein